MFSGGSTNLLELHNGGVITGDVLAAGSADSFRLGGVEDGTFDVSLIGPSRQYRNFEYLQKTGGSTWTITGQATNQPAPWAIYDGTLMMSAGSDLGDVPLTNYSGTFAGIGTVGPVSLYGPTLQAPGGAIIAPGVNDIGTLTIDGTFHSDRGVLQIETELGDDTSPTDLLRVTGNTSGSTNVRVNNVGGTGAQTVEGIRIVQVDGTSEGAFSLLGDYVFQGEQAVVAGAYAYRLYQGSVSDPTDGDWYLRSAAVPDPDP
ncbi:autotransporter outer membrane beta-barrel domain-containing protein, partial [Chelativorans sp.]|uniref:autotransporter outer membrane beta-barrel domain-containing protein n=1 Tax=Chelativorans sp. TaxID=2203393 RepID=UPI0028119BD0